MTTDRKRRKVEDSALSRLAASVKDVKQLSDALSTLVQRQSSQTGSRPLRVVSHPASDGHAPPSQKNRSTSLVSLVPASALASSSGSGSDRKSESDWQQRLARLVEGDADASAQYTRLARRYESLAATVRHLEARVKQHSDAGVRDRVEAQLEKEEQAWEADMQTRERQVAALETELRTIRQDGDADELEEDEEEEDEEEADEGELPEAAEQQALLETLALRKEEQRDIEAAIGSLRRAAAVATKRHRPPVSDGHGPTSGAWAELASEKAALEAAILSMEREQERAEAERGDVARLKQSLKEHAVEKRQVQAVLEAHRARLTRLKDKMRRMVAHTSTTEAVLLQLLFENAGEMAVAELKAEAAQRLQGSENSGAVVRALYSLVAHGVVQIDRSVGSGLVTSLLV
ncbi:hypothetical protein P43SY_008397 [Pythium insidiosum]|uniref:Uncharacterized protein n=1 Tax=Pythium insidiosum TaxID=114742 RepID=A0AAD5LGS2_PYTIN|nr:hypothetical protein P43SY_008397 [Pythium insidiosum]